jgi:hypothetical protein
MAAASVCSSVGSRPAKALSMPGVPSGVGQVLFVAAAAVADGADLAVEVAAPGHALGRAGEADLVHEEGDPLQVVGGRRADRQLTRVDDLGVGALFLGRRRAGDQQREGEQTEGGAEREAGAGHLRPRWPKGRLR